MTNEMIERLFEFRDELGRREEAVMKQMARLWLNVERGVREEAEALAEEIARRQALGEAVPIQFVRRWERYRRYTEQAQAQLRSYDAAVQPILERGVRANLQLGLDSANEALELAYSGVEAPSWSRLNVEAVEQMAGMLRPTTALGALLRRGSDLAFDEAEAALVRGLALGRGAKQVAADIADAAGFSFERSILIARTEMNRAYRFASTAQYRDSGVVTGFRRLVYKPTACFACLMMDGEYYPVSQELYDHPRGKCGVVPVVVGGHSPSWETGSEWFTKLPEEEQRRIMGAGRYELWKGGGVRDLRTMVWMKPNAQWGPAPAFKTIEQFQNDLSIPFADRVNAVMDGNGNPDYIQLTNAEVREVYVTKVKNISDEIDPTLSLENQARAAFEKRNQYRTNARTLMEDLVLRLQLDYNRPNRTWEEIYRRKTEKKGLTHEEALRDIIRSSTTTDEEVDAMFGLGRNR